MPSFCKVGEREIPEGKIYLGKNILKRFTWAAHTYVYVHGCGLKVEGGDFPVFIKVDNLREILTPVSFQALLERV